MRELPLLARELWKSLWVEEADDHGRCEAWAQALHGRLFSGSPDVSAADVDQALHVLAAAGLLRLYEVAGESYAVFSAADWLTQGIDKPSEPLYPCPACHRTECHVEGCTCKRCMEHKDETGCRCRTCRPCKPADQMDLPLGAEGARRGKRERAERGAAAAAEQAHREPASGGAGADPGVGGGLRQGGTERGGGAAAERGGHAAQRGEGAVGEADDLDGVGRAGERAGRDEAGPEEPANGAVAQTAERRQVVSPSPSHTAPTPGAAIEGGTRTYGGSIPSRSTDPRPCGDAEAPRRRDPEPAPISPPASAEAISSATPAAGAGGLPVLRLLALLEASPRFKVAPPPARRRELRNGAEDQARRGLPAWLWAQLAERVRESDPSEDQVRHAARFLDAGGWGFTQTVTPQHLAARPGLLDLLTQSGAWEEGRPAGRAPARRENTFDTMADRLEEREGRDVIDAE